MPLPPKVFDTLLILVANSGHLLSKDELMRELWPGTFVGEGTLTQCISLLRKALGEGGKWIENHPRRGYRFVEPVRELADDASPYDTGGRNGFSRPAERELAAKDEAPENAAGAQPLAVTDAAETAPLRVLWPGRSWRFAAGIALIVLSTWLVAGGRSKSGGSAGEGAPASRLIRLTATPGLNTDPALSPDGSVIAYASDRSGTSGFDIWVQPVAGGEPLQLSRDPGDETEPSFSPDSARIVYSEREAEAIKVVGVFGGAPRVVVRVPWARMPRFSPDGRWIVYWTGFLPTVVPRGLPGATGSVFIVPSTGGSPVQLAPQFASARYPIWSPDSTHVLFLGEQNGSEESYDWYVADINDRSVVRTGVISALRAAQFASGTPVPGGWRSSDDAVVFATNEMHSSNVWKIPVSRSTGRVSGVPERLTFGTAIERAPTVAASGRIAFASVVEKLGVWRAPLDPQSGLATAAFERVTDGTANERLRNASRDGRVVSYISSRTGRDEVWIRDLETGREHQVTVAGGEDATLAPNGSTVAFSRRNAWKSEIQVLEKSASLPYKLCENCGVPADWSPDSRRLLFHRGSPTQLIMYDFSSAKETIATSHAKWGLFQARFSPDGGWIAFHTTNSPEVRQVYAMPVPPGQSTAQAEWVPIVTDHGCHPNWSADGSLLYHFSFRDGAFCPWVQRVDPETKRPLGQPRAVKHLHQPRLRATLGAAANNDVVSGYLYITASETTGNIWLIEPRVKSKP
jgi:Tol biopolymer transport system component/DNA-binding winged helix-turn-helix (wHTH) protein